MKEKTNGSTDSGENSCLHLPALRSSDGPGPSSPRRALAKPWRAPANLMSEIGRPDRLQSSLQSGLQNSPGAGYQRVLVDAGASFGPLALTGPSDNGDPPQVGDYCNTSCVSPWRSWSVGRSAPGLLLDVDVPRAARTRSVEPAGGRGVDPGGSQRWPPGAGVPGLVPAGGQGASESRGTRVAVRSGDESRALSVVHRSLRHLVCV